MQSQMPDLLCRIVLVNNSDLIVTMMHKRIYRPICNSTREKSSGNRLGESAVLLESSWSCNKHASLYGRYKSAMTTNGETRPTVRASSSLYRGLDRYRVRRDSGPSNCRLHRRTTLDRSRAFSNKQPRSSVDFGRASSRHLSHVTENNGFALLDGRRTIDLNLIIHIVVAFITVTKSPSPSVLSEQRLQINHRR